MADRSKKSPFSIRHTLLASIGILNVIIAVFAISAVHQSWQRYYHATLLRNSSDFINLLHDAHTTLSLARGAALAALYADRETAASLKESLQENRTLYESEISTALSRVSPDESALVPPIQKAHEELSRLYDRLTEEIERPKEDRDFHIGPEIFRVNIALIDGIKNLMTERSKPMQPIDARVTQHTLFKSIIWDFTEYAAQEYAMIGALIALDQPVTREQRRRLSALRERIQYGWEMVMMFPLEEQLARKLAPAIRESESHYFETFKSMKDDFYRTLETGPAESFPVTAEIWLGIASQAVDTLLTLQDTILQETQDHVRVIETNSIRSMLLSVLTLLITITISVYCWRLIVIRVTRPIDAMVGALYKATRGEAYDPPEIVHYGDEIGKLATVLDAFQLNAQKIKQSNEELERYAFITAHDLKSPLRAIDNLSQWIEEDLGDTMSPETRNHMDLLRGRVHRMEKLLSDILDYSRIDRQYMTQKSDVVDAKSLVEDAASFAFPPEGYEIIISPILSSIQVQRIPLQQVFYNLINNAIKHNTNASGMIEVGVSIEPDHYVFSVKDNGPGIPAEYHAKIFEMFQTLHPRDKREGSGMGLAFVKKILTGRGSAITVESEPGQGALFRFTWPKEVTGNAYE